MSDPSQTFEDHRVSGKKIMQPGDDCWPANVPYRRIITYEPHDQ
jgi:hypothetical protein